MEGHPQQQKAQPRRTRHRWGWWDSYLYLWWVVAAFVGSDIGGHAAAFLGGYASLSAGRSWAAFGAMFGLVFGAVQGLALALVLWGRLRFLARRSALPGGGAFSIRQWVLASAGGAALGGGIAWAIYAGALPLGKWAARWSIFAVVSSIAQWLVLRRFLPQSALWVPLNAASIVAGWTLAGALNLGWPQRIDLAAAIYALLMGFVVAWLLRER